MDERPNILLLMADQLADPWLAHAITPAIDRLAAEGITFANAYSNSPLCAPARYAMMSGQLNSKIGAYLRRCVVKRCNDRLRSRRRREAIDPRLERRESDRAQRNSSGVLGGFPTCEMWARDRASLHGRSTDP